MYRPRCTRSSTRRLQSLPSAVSSRPSGNETRVTGTTPTIGVPRFVRGVDPEQENLLYVSVEVRTRRVGAVRGNDKGSTLGHGRFRSTDGSEQTVGS